MLRVRNFTILLICCAMAVLYFLYAWHVEQSSIGDSWQQAPVNLSQAIKINKLPQDDPYLITIVRHNFLLQPPETDNYNLENPNLKDPSMGQSEKIKEILGDKTGGFFVECGALDGETRSNTLYFERYKGWTGLLIEADPLNFKDVIKKRRRAWLSPVCLSLKPYPTLVSFAQHSNMGRISGLSNGLGLQPQGFVEVQCLPLVSLLLALNRTSIDYFSLDIEGDELAVLRTIPFDRFDIMTLSVEFSHVDAGKAAILSFMRRRGYRLHGEVTADNNLANDFIFVKVNSST